MEAFGLLNFLKSIFPAPDAPADASDRLDAAPPSVAEKKSVPSVENTTAQNAFTSFLATHDERIRRIRR